MEEALGEFDSRMKENKKCRFQRICKLIVFSHPLCNKHSFPIKKDFEK